MAPPLFLAHALQSAICLLLLGSFPFTSTFSLVETGSTLYLGSVPYYIPTTPFITLNSLSLRQHYDAKKSSGGLLPVTVVNVNNSEFGIRELSDVVNGFAEDDVWGEGFLDGKSRRTNDILFFNIFFFLKKNWYIWKNRLRLGSLDFWAGFLRSIKNLKVLDLTLFPRFLIFEIGNAAVDFCHSRDFHEYQELIYMLELSQNSQMIPILYRCIRSR